MNKYKWTNEQKMNKYKWTNEQLEMDKWTNEQV